METLANIPGDLTVPIRSFTLSRCSQHREGWTPEYSLRIQAIKGQHYEQAFWALFPLEPLLLMRTVESFSSQHHFIDSLVYSSVLPGASLSRPSGI